MKSKAGWFSLSVVLCLPCFCVFQYGALSIVTALFLVISKSICLTMLDDSRIDTDAFSYSGWLISGTCSTCSENSEGFIGDSVDETRVENEAINCWYQYKSIDVA